MSPWLFLLFLNDLSKVMSERYGGVQNLTPGPSPRAERGKGAGG
jgi:hypothetical protein